MGRRGILAAFSIVLESPTYTSNHLYFANLKASVKTSCLKSRGKGDINYTGINKDYFRHQTYIRNGPFILTLNTECEHRCLIFNYILQKGKQLIIIPLKAKKKLGVFAVL